MQNAVFRLGLASLFAFASSSSLAAPPRLEPSGRAPSSRPAAMGLRARAGLSVASWEKRPKLVVALVIDQFRADYLTRFSSRFLPAKGPGSDVGGFRFLMENGAYWPAARYDVLQSMTCPGHAMVLTGSYPYMNGIPLNEWYDPARGRLSYCAYDPESPVVGLAEGEGDSESEGVSPRNLIGTTVGDELKNAGHASRVVAIAIKDRSAIFLGGHRADSAIWLSKNFQWVTSRHYAKNGRLPEWVSELNRALAKRKGESVDWRVQDKGTGLTAPEPNEAFSRTSKLGSKDSLRYAPGIELTVDAAVAAARALKLGAGKAPDVLAVSFSTHDILGHDVGPNARDMEEITVVEDRAVSRLLNAIRKQTPGGLDDVLVVLTGDHGVSPTVPYLSAAGIPAAQIDDQDLLRSAEKAMVEAYGAPPSGSKWMAAVRSFNFYFERESLRKKSIASSAAEATVKAALAKEPGCAFAFGRGDRAERRLPPGQHERQILKTYVEGKSGDVVMIPKPFHMEKGAGTTHMTGYAYDRTVPIAIYGRHVRPGVRAESADVVDVAPTLSFLLGVLPPASSEGRVLSEALGD